MGWHRISELTILTASMPRTTPQISWPLFKAWRQLIPRHPLQQVGALTLANGFSEILNFFQGIFVARWLGPELYGTAVLVMSLPRLVYAFFDARSSQASTKYLSEFHVRKESEQAVAMCQLGYAVDFTIASCSLVVTLFLSSWAANHIVHRPELSWLIILYSVGFLPGALKGTSDAVLTTLEKFHLLAKIRVLGTFVRVGTIMALVLSGFGVVGMILGNVVGSAFTGLISWFVAWRIKRTVWTINGSRPRWAILGQSRKEILTFLGFNQLNSLLEVIPKQLDTVVLGYFRSAPEAGLYRLGKTFATAVGILAGPLQSVCYPEFSRLWGSQGYQELRDSVRRWALGFGLPLALIVILGLLLLPRLILMTAGEEYQGAGEVCQILFIGSGIFLVLFWLRPLYLAAGEIRFWVGFGSISAGVAIIAYPITAVFWGIYGIACSRVLVTFIRYLLAGVWVWRGKLGFHRKHA